MELRRALDLDDRAVVSFVGAGGKKSAMGQLVRERGDRAVGYTTTTNMPPPPALPLVLLAPPQLDTLRRTRRTPIALASAAIDDPDRVPVKVRGFDPTAIDRVAATGVFDWLLVKADGARGREVTAPAEHEPAIPASSTNVVVVVSVAAVGQAVNSSAIHRPDRVATLAGVDPTETVSVDILADVVAHDAGGLKGIPASATAVVLVNKADTPAQRAVAEAVIAAVKSRTDRFDRGIVSSFAAERLAVMFDH